MSVLLDGLYVLSTKFFFSFIHFIKIRDLNTHIDLKDLHLYYCIGHLSLATFCIMPIGTIYILYTGTMATKFKQ